MTIGKQQEALMPGKPCHPRFFQHKGFSISLWLPEWKPDTELFNYLQAPASLPAGISHFLEIHTASRLQAAPAACGALQA